MEYKPKKTIKKQNYEEYWRLTVEYSDINGSRFINTLKLIVNFIDKNPSLKTEYDSNLYKELQEIINEIYKKRDFGSIRKSINQMVKLGLVYQGLRGYHPKT